MDVGRIELEPMGRSAFPIAAFGLALAILPASRTSASPSYLDVAYGPVQAGLEIGFSLGSGRYLQDSRVDVVFRTRNVSGVRVSQPTLSKTLEAFVRDESGKVRPVKSYCIDRYAVDSEPLMAAGATRIEILTLDLQCDGMKPGLFSLTFAARTSTVRLLSNAVAFVVASGTSSGSGAGCDEPKMVHAGDLIYPDSLRSVRASGVSEIQVVLDERGVFNSASVYRSSGFIALDEAALAAARASKYSPPSAECPPLFLFRADFSTR
jgi:TonB family protein